jgi:hypothetical protein
MRTKRARSTAPKAPTPDLLPPETPAKITVPAISGIAMVASAKLLWVNPGAHRLTIASLGASPSNAGGMSLPVALVTVPDAGETEPVEIVMASANGTWLGGDGGSVILRAPPEGGPILVTTYALPDQATSPLELDLSEIDDEEAALAASEETRRSLRAEIILHIERTGDRRFPAEGWAGRVGSHLRIEALAVHPLELISRGEIEYKAFSHGGRETPWVTDGRLCGTRGQSMPLTGFAIRLAPHLRDGFDVEYRGSFFTGGPVPTVRNGEPCKAPVTDDPLEAVEVKIVEH